MLQYVLAGLALGSIYAIASASLVVTFVSAGVLNFAFGSMAYFVARFYYWLNSQHGWSTDAAGVGVAPGGGTADGRRSSTPCCSGSSAASRPWSSSWPPSACRSRCLRSPT